ncbi:semaphorin-5A-like [Oculina patagonica]
MTPFSGRYLVFFIYFSTFPAWSEESSNAVSRARTSFEAIKSHVETLNTREIESGSFSLLSVDEKNNHLLVGAKDNAFLLDLENIHDFKSWNLTNPATSSACDRKQDDQCHDYVKIMLPFNERIFLCWTGTPMTAGCAWRNRTNLSDAPGKDSKGMVFTADVEYSSSPDQNDTAIITEHGTIFTGTINPYSWKSMIHSRSFKQPKLREVFTSLMDQSDFYTDVHFVKSFIIGHYVYFFFRERTWECSSCGKQKISRVARICKGDYGGDYFLKKNFITFQKAKLSCSDGGDFPLNFNEIQDVWWDKQTNLFHASFISHPNGPPSSAICVYNLSDINHVFDESSFKSFDNQAKQWVTVANNYQEYFKDCKVNPKYIDPSNTVAVPDGMMATRKMTYNAYRQLRHDPLMEDPVQPTSFNSQSKKVARAWFIKDGIRMTAIALDKVGANTVVYTSTDRGSVLKISKPAGVHQPCLLTELDIFPSNKREVIKAMAIDTTRHVLYLGSRTTLTKLSLEQCSSHEHHSSCISAADPYCAWDKETRRCVSILSHGDPSKLRQDLTTCPELTEEVSEWSPWQSCVQSDGNLCRCQARPCSNGQNSSCEGGYEFRLQNCTVDVSVGWEGKEAWETFGVQHGNWSFWGTWSECSAEAWAGVRNRTRTCTHPVPKRGGRPCVGESVQYEPCSLGLEEKGKRLWTNPTRVLNPTVNMAVQFNVLCKATGHKITDVSVEISNKTIDCEKEPNLCGEGEWDKWSDWSQCSVEGFQIRRRECKVEPCVGERIQERKCEPTTSDKCKGAVDVDSWDEWSVCECNHELNLSEGSDLGVKYRIHKCRRECPTVLDCPNTVQYETCSCQSAGVSGRRQGPVPSEGSKLGIGHVIGAAVIGCVFTIILCGAALYYYRRRQKQFNVSKAEETSLHNTSTGSKYSTIPRGNGVATRGPPSTSSSQSTASKDSINPRKKTSSPLKMLRLFRKQESSAEAV